MEGVKKYLNVALLKTAEISKNIYSKTADFTKKTLEEVDEMYHGPLF